jgi:hypothetical protein
MQTKVLTMKVPKFDHLAPVVADRPLLEAKENLRTNVLPLLRLLALLVPDLLAIIGNTP